MHPEEMLFQGLEFNGAASQNQQIRRPPKSPNKYTANSIRNTTMEQNSMTGTTSDFTYGGGSKNALAFDEDEPSLPNMNGTDNKVFVETDNPFDVP